MMNYIIIIVGVFEIQIFCIKHNYHQVIKFNDNNNHNNNNNNNNNMNNIFFKNIDEYEKNKNMTLVIILIFISPLFYRDNDDDLLSW